MVAAQWGACAICRRPAEKWVVDHDHKFHERDPKGRRGALCNACNLMLGQAKDSPDVLRAAAAYLERWRCERDQGVPA